MAEKSTPEQTPEQAEVRRRGRQRLIGAVAIVLLAVVFVPMALDPEARKDRQEPSLDVPAKEGAPKLPAPVPAKAAPAPVATIPAAPPKVVEPKSAEFKPAPKSPVTVASAPPAAPTVASAPPATTPLPAVAPKLEGFAVQVGAFRDEEKLRQAREKLTAAKIVHFTERLAASDLTRLRAGPYPTREAADKALATIALSGLEGKVVPLP